MGAHTQRVVLLALLMGALVTAPIVRASSPSRSAREHEPRGTSEYLAPLPRSESDEWSIDDLRQTARSDGGRYVDLGQFSALRGRDVRTGR